MSTVTGRRRRLATERRRRGRDALVRFGLRSFLLLSSFPHLLPHSFASLFFRTLSPHPVFPVSSIYWSKGRRMTCSTWAAAASVIAATAAAAGGVGPRWGRDEDFDAGCEQQRGRQPWRHPPRVAMREGSRHAGSCASRGRRWWGRCWRRAAADGEPRGVKPSREEGGAGGCVNAVARWERTHARATEGPLSSWLWSTS